MYVFLFVVGVLAAAAGLALVVTGVSVHEGAAASALATPGTIAFLGGLLLVGIGIAVRQLQRIERTLAARPTMPHPARPAEAAVAAAAVVPVAGERPAAPARTAPKGEPRAQPAPSLAAAAAPTEDAAIERLREKFPTLVRLESVAAVGEANVSPVTQGRLDPAEQELSEVKRVSVGGSPQVSAPVRAAPRLKASGRPTGAPERPKASVFEAFWPQGQRQRRNGTTAAPVPAAPPTPPASAAQAATTAPVEPARGAEAAGPYAATAEPATADAALAPPAATRMPAPISILKSGVVEGMAYALYSDGSIEAQLPQGRLRFGSIAELRYHIENDSNGS